MRYLVIVIFLLGIFNPAFTQVSFKTNLTDSRLAKLKRAKDARSKLATYKKMQLKDSLQAAKERKKALRDSLGRKGFKQYQDSLADWKDYKKSANGILARSQHMQKFNRLKDKVPDKIEKPNLKALDSLKGKIPDDSLKALKKQYIKEHMNVRDQLGLPDSLQVDLPDSLKGMAVMAKYGMYGTMMETYASRKGLPTDSTSLANQLAVEEKVKAFLPESMQSSEGFGNYQNNLGISEMNQDDPTGSMVSQLPPEQAKAASTAMSILKKGYISVPNSNDLSTAKKRNSLKGAPLKQRIFLGGNVALQSIRPAILDVDIQIGYKFNRDFVVGTGFIVREQFDNLPSGLVGDAYGNSLFASHDLPFGLFAYAEFQNMKEQSLFQENQVEATWQQAMNAGIGKELPLTKWLNLTAMILYDFNHKNNNLHPRPIVVRFGYRVSELAFRKK